MKKILVLLVVLLSGCSNKLTCTYKEKYDDVTISNKIVFDLKNNSYKQIDKMIFESEEDAIDYFDDISDYIEEYNLKLNKNIIVSELEDKLTSTKTKKELKKQYESYDYKCK